MEPLFPELPEDLSEKTDEDLANLLAEHEHALDLIEKEDEEYTKDVSAEDLLSELERGVEQVDAIKAEQAARVEAQEEYQAKKAALLARSKGETVEAEEAEVLAEAEEGTEEAAAEPEATEESEDENGEAEAEPEAEPEAEEAAAEAVTAAAAPAKQPVRRLSRPPAPSAEREAGTKSGAPLITASGHQDVKAGVILDKPSLAKAMKQIATRRGRPSKSLAGVEERILVASAQFEFPEERILQSGDWEENARKIEKQIPQSVPGQYGSMALVASGGFCAPFEPIYTMPNFASQARPVRDALPSFQADRGGVNIPEATVIGDITSAITLITADEDAEGGTFATKSCQDLECPAYNETAVTIISHCREYGNLNAMAWPEKIAHENDLTMAAHARTAETYLLDRIKALSLNVTNGAETLGAYIYLVDAIVKAAFGIRTRLRMDPGAQFRALLPYWVPDLLLLDTVQSLDGNRFTSEGELVAYLRNFGINPSWYMDSPTTGTSQIADSAQTAAAIDPLPDNIQWALFPEGAFLHLDAGSLELGIVRDSTLNSTNDFQIFGESFENVARVAPQQATYWITSDLCANGMLAPAGTARTCD